MVFSSVICHIEVKSKFNPERRTYDTQLGKPSLNTLCCRVTSKPWPVFAIFWVTNTLCIFVNGELAFGFLELSLSFYGRPNISDRFTFHFIRIQIFQIDFPLILYLQGQNEHLSIRILELSLSFYGRPNISDVHVGKIQWKYL